MNVSKTILVSFLAGLLAGCGSSNEQAAQQPSGLASAPQPVLFGRVLDEKGAAQREVRVIVHERTSNAKSETTSNSDGSYRLNLPAGVYDLALDRTDDPEHATCYYGPVTVSTQESRDFILRSSQGRSRSQVWGKILAQPGVPAAQRMVKFITHNLPPDSAGRPQLDAGSAVTSADGTFTANLISERELGLDVEVYDGQGSFQEFIDIGKLAKPCYVEFATELPVPVNLLRSYQDQTPRATTDVADTPDSPPSNYVPFNRFGYYRPFVWADGLLPISDWTYPSLYSILSPTALQEAQFIFGAYYVNGGGPPTTPIRVSADGWWPWRYAVHLDLPSIGIFDKPYGLHFQFTDQSPDSYYLFVDLGGGHRVNYNSKMPDIVQLEYIQSN